MWFMLILQNEGTGETVAHPELQNSVEERKSCSSLEKNE